MIADVIGEFDTGTRNEQARIAGRVTVEVVLTLIAIKGVAKSVQTITTSLKNGTFGASLGKGMTANQSLKNIIGKSDNPLDYGVNFAATPLAHMENSKRFVPIQTLIEVIKNTKAYPDPSGTLNTFMHYSKVFIRGKEYNLEVLYNVPTNTIYHFKYTQDAIGPLSRIN